MKVLLIKPMEHPQVVDIENSLKEFYRILDCDCITATYPWEERAALVTDEAFSYYECVGYTSLDFLDLVCDVYAKV